MNEPLEDKSEVHVIDLIGHKMEQASRTLVQIKHHLDRLSRS